MIILIGGASHTGKTVLSARLIEKYKYPCFSLDHLKMGLIRSGRTTHTPEDDELMTDELWGIVKEIIKTAVENSQNLIIEGCYIPYNWKESFTPEYLCHIKCVFLVMSDGYIENNFSDIKAHANDIEKRLDDGYCAKEQLKKDNRAVLLGCEEYGCEYILIDKDYDITELEGRI